MAQAFSYGSEDGEFYFRAVRTSNPDLDNFYLHTHDGYEILYLISGKLTCHIEGNTYCLKPDDMILTNAYELHRSAPDPSVCYERKYLRFKPSFLLGIQVSNYNLFAGLENRKLGHNNLIPAQVAQEHNLIQAMNEIHQYALSGKPDDLLMIKITLVKMLVTINRLLFATNIIESSSVKTDDLTKKILNYLNANLTKKLTLESIQKEFHISKYHLTRLFKHTTGFSFTEYVSYKRIMLAARMMIDYGCFWQSKIPEHGSVDVHSTLT